MIPKECKRLAEVDFPIAEVSRHAAREKSIRHGHPSTLHLWWARRPLASSRAVLMALLLPDPCDPQCPDEFKGKARETLLAMRGRASGWDSTVKTDEGLRRVLLRSTTFAGWRRLFLPVHPLFLTTLLGHSGAVAGHVEFKDDRVVDHPVDGRRRGHWVGKDALPLREDQI